VGGGRCRPASEGGDRLDQTQDGVGTTLFVRSSHLGGGQLISVFAQQLGLDPQKRSLEGNPLVGSESHLGAIEAIGGRSQGPAELLQARE